MKTKVICLLALTALTFTACKKEEKTAAPVASNATLDTNPPVVQQQVETKEVQPVSSSKPAEMTFTKKTHDFGTINQGDSVMHVFTFKNTGKNDLIITRAVGSCGCTVPEYPKEPVAPGKTGTMKVSFNSKGKTGPQHKTVTITANVPDGAVVLEIQANVKPEKTKNKN